ncbi:PAS domain-containing protein [Natrinema sp. 1APR25-10V2]|uniref:PAS domain-containing protein n=1 Tax=Natrinema sp. 1APR25-10V2 TaxID=2951081 RepID=UPI002875D175|nr:PAS domain-containing protein [Natrinema sp. 1APR25-10V2]MDS0474677.1 PAS domain-containing protein [Natrinema sp. 1APR25-10V2]
MNSLTLLCAVGEPVQSDLLQTLDQEAKFEVLRAETETQTLAFLEEESIDMLLFRCGFTDTGTNQFLRQVRQQKPLLPVIALVGDESTSLTETSRSKVTATVPIHRSNVSGRVQETIQQVILYLHTGQEHTHDQSKEILNQITDGFYTLDDDWRFTYVNKTAETLLQQSADDLLGCTLWEVFPEVTETIVPEEFRHAKDTGENIEFEIYYEPLETWFHILAVPSQMGLSVFLQDITSRTLLTRAMDTAELGIVITDPKQPDNPIVYANEGFETLTGYTEADVRGRNCRFLHGPRTRTEAIQQIQTAVDTHESISIAIVHYRKDGSPFWNQVQIAPVFEPQGRLTHFISFHQNITTRIEEERRVELLHRVLRHNLRNGMNVILGQASLLEENSALAEDQITPILESGTELLQIAERARDIDAVLDHEHFEPTAISVRQAAATAIDAVSCTYPDAEIITEVPDGLSVIASGALAVAVEELLENGIKHAETSCPAITVATERGVQQFHPAGEDWPVVQISVIDSAPLLTEQEQTVLLGEGETPLRHGSGLGLWLVQWIVTLSGGIISVTEHPSGGNEITLMLLDAKEAIGNHQ